MAIKWKIDPSHSEIQFKVKHLMITTVTGHFKQFDLLVETETENFASAKKLNSPPRLILSTPIMHSVMRI